VINGLSIDLEDWFCVHSLSSVIGRAEWDKCQLRVVESTNRILEILDRYKVHATFFVLGWIADRVPGLIKRIECKGHEIASHGYYHLRVPDITAEEFDEDLDKSLSAIKECGVKQTILGFRAPSFSIVDKTRWALRILEKYNIRYDSSILPVRWFSGYGFGNSPLGPYKITDALYEFPLSCIMIGRVKVPFGGGVFFHIFPYIWIKYCIRKCNSEGRPVVLYIHPWELDPEHPRVKAPWLSRARHYYNLRAVEPKLEKILTDFHFTSIREVLGL
jgi:polysaccharide deacetylase family protein (PEP-CTERM system associated)